MTEHENKLLKEREGDREKLMGLELSDGQPLNEHMVQLKLKYQKCKMELEGQIKQQQSRETELSNNIKAIRLDIDKLETNVEQLRNKATRTQNRISSDEKDFREKKDEIENEINRCNKTNKQAFNDLLDTKNEINEMLNKKRETERKIEDENKKFREIENELFKKIAELNKFIAERKAEQQNLKMDQNDNISLRRITDKFRDLDMEVGELNGNVDTNHNNVVKMEKQITTYLEKMKENYDEIAKYKTRINAVTGDINKYKEERCADLLDEKLNNHAQIMIFKLDLETQQEQSRSDQFFESIKQIEQETNKFRNNYIKECNEKDELKGG